MWNNPSSSQILSNSQKFSKKRSLINFVERMKELTEQKPCHVKIAEESSAILVLYKIMKRLTPKTKCMNIRNVGEPFLSPPSPKYHRHQIGPTRLRLTHIPEEENE
ncbi:hypothetical protein QTO34_015488 [Cnephaeus nilssonii]|uniref:Uncharacterized protein n=1 Tax=Cnephaeus nilssonii TaxID=3371016 RepID=A0AA40LSX0_CNENI|nr:hypothetical protein QTO34_015488 [Eptesicus nilssonii]